MHVTRAGGAGSAAQRPFTCRLLEGERDVGLQYDSSRPESCCRTDHGAEGAGFEVSGTSEGFSLAPVPGGRATWAGCAHRAARSSQHGARERHRSLCTLIAAAVGKERNPSA